MTETTPHDVASSCSSFASTPDLSFKKLNCSDHERGWMDKIIILKVSYT